MGLQNAMLRDRPSASAGPHAAAPTPQKNGPVLPSIGAMPLLIFGLVLGVADALLPYWAGLFDATKAPGMRISVFVLALLALYILLTSISVGVADRISGVFWSSRNTYSLSRLQIVLWTFMW